MNLFARLFFLLMFLSTTLWSEVPKIDWYTKDKQQRTVLNVELFLSSTCPHCHKADAFFKSIEAKNPWFQVHRHIINTDKTGLLLFSQLLAAQNMSDYSVPSIFFCNARWVGFRTPETTGQDLLKSMKYCFDAIEKDKTLSNNTVNVIKEQAEASRGSQILSPYTTLKTIFIIALVDVLNPCSFFTILAFFGILFMQVSLRTRIQFGLLFIISLALTHGFQQVYMLSFFNLLPWLRIPAVFVGFLALYLAFRHYKGQSSKAFFYIAIPLLAVMVSLYQQTCLRNLSFLFEQWIRHQNFTPGQIKFYEVIYQLVYIVPLLLALILCSLLISIKRLSGFAAWLDGVGILFIIAIGLILMIYPLALASLTLCLVILFVSIIGSWFLTRHRSAKRLPK